MSFHLSPIGNDQQFDANGDPLNGGKIYTYLAGTTTPVATYTDDTGVTPQANPIILNSLGAPASPIWLTGGVTYKFVIKDANDVTLRTIDDISGINDSTSNAADEWTLYGSAPTYTSATSFTLVGDQTLIFQVGRRLKSANTGGTIYSSILTSTYSAPNTTITVVNDSGSLDAGMSAVRYALLNATNPSVPYQYAKKADIQGQTCTAFTTAGTATAFTLTPNPAITALTANQRFRVKMDQANSGTTPTLAVSGLAATAIKMVAADGSKRDPVAGELAANLLVDFEYDGTNWVARAIPPQLATATPLPNGTAAVGTSVKAAREDHVHASSGGDFQRFDASNTWIKPSGYSNDSLVIVEAWGAGGGGGGTNAGSSGGGGGSYARKEMLYSDAAASYIITIGAGAVNTAGGNTTVGSILTAYGGGRGRTTAGSSGGGGGGAISAGSDGTSSAGGAGGAGGNGYAGQGGAGGVGATSAAVRGGFDGGGGGGAGAVAADPLSRDGATGCYGGGGGGGGGSSTNQAGNGANSYYSGAGGAGDSAAGADGTAGTSVNGGNGGAVDTAGAVPGGGGGGGSTGGAGGGGRVQITVIERA